MALLSLLALAAAPSAGENRRFPFELPPKVAPNGGPIREAVIGPVFRRPFACTEHPEGQLEYAGDALGTDCLIIGGVESPTKGFMKAYRTDGMANADWYGWDQDVLAPFDGVVDTVYENRTENSPGETGKPPASMIRFRRVDGLIVVYAHIQAIAVRKGDRVIEGQAVAKVGNNGFARNPHIHIGAYKGSTPYQIRWDLRVMGRMGIGQE